MTLRGAIGALGVLALVGLVAGCSARATLQVTVRADGSGTAAVHVTLDAEAVQAAEGGAPLSQQVRLSDLRAAGWTVSPWRTALDGSASIVLTKGFRTPDQLAQIVAELNGPDGPIRHLAVSRDPTWGGFAHTVQLAGTVDLRAAQPGVPADAALVRALAAQHVDVSVVEAQLAGSLASSVSLRLVLVVPGGRHVVTVPPDGHGTVTTQSTAVDVPRTALAGAAILLVVLAGLAWLRGRRAGTRRRGGAARR